MNPLNPTLAVGRLHPLGPGAQNGPLRGKRHGVGGISRKKLGIRRKGRERGRAVGGCNGAWGALIHPKLGPIRLRIYPNQSHDRTDWRPNWPFYPHSGRPRVKSFAAMRRDRVQTFSHKNPPAILHTYSAMHELAGTTKSLPGQKRVCGRLGRVELTATQPAQPRTFGPSPTGRNASPINKRSEAARRLVLGERTKEIHC